MPSSIKMVKASNTYGGDKTAKIDIQFDELESEQASTTVDSEIEYSQAQSQVILKKAQTKSEQLMMKAEKEAKELKAAAKEEGQKAGQEVGYQKGYQQGLDQGLKEAQVENEAARAQLLVMLKEAKAEISEYQKDKKNELILLASHMAEKIVHDYIDHSDKGILQLADSFFNQLDREEEFITITVNGKSREIINEKITRIENIFPNTRFIIFGNPDMKDYDMIIESSKAVIDLRIKNQIEMMLKEFSELERTVDA